MFQSPLGEVVKETKRFSLKYLPGIGCVFQSTLGEVVKETFATREMYGGGEKGIGVSIPSRGSGKGDPITGINMTSTTDSLFQSPLGEVVKETVRPGSLTQKGFQASNRRTIFYLSIRR